MRVERIWTVVVLPAPFGSEQREDGPFGDLEVDAVEDDLVAERLAQARPRGSRSRRDSIAVMPRPPEDGDRGPGQMSRSSTAAAGRPRRPCRRAAGGILAELLERVDDFEGRLAWGAAVADVADPEVAAPAGRLAFVVDHRVVGAVLDVEDELAGPAAIDAERLDAAGRGVDPLAEEDRR